LTGTQDSPLYPRLRRRALGALAAVAALVLVSPAGAHVRVGGSAPVSSSGVPAQQPAEPPAEPAPRAECGPGSRPEPDIQGRVPKQEVDSGRADEGYRCNMSVLGRSGSTGGFRVHRYIDRAGRECAYYDTTLLFPTNALSLSLEPTGVAVLDMSDPSRPVRTTTLVTPAMQSPHESLNISVNRGILAAVLGNPTQYPGGIDVYDISEDCRNPVPLAAGFPASPFGHESGMAPDGQTFYPTSIGTDDTTAVDISNPRLPRTIWNGKYNTHGMDVSDDGRRGYFAAADGLIIVDLSQVQDRVPNPQVREISRLRWSNITIPQYAVPVTIGGRPYLVEVDEYSATDEGEFTAHGDRVGAARIIDISDETRPFVVSNIRLEVHQKENRDAIAADYGAQSPVQGYAAHYCNVPQRREPGIVACSMITSGLRVFDIRDPRRPREIAYHVAPPSNVSATGGPTIDERSNWAMSQPAFVPERGEIWYSDGTSGFYALKVDPDVWPFGAAGGGPGAGTRALQLSVAPRRVRVGRRVRLRFSVRSAGSPVRSATVRIAGRTTRTDRRGRAQLVVRFGSARLHTARATRAGYRSDTARVRSVRAASLTG
jgi:hypothetical protein